jgi:hypothetical protein
MADWFAIDDLDVERLLADWRWLCPNRMSLVAKTAFGDMFLRDETEQIYRLEVASGKLLKVADSEAQFRELAISKREEWFAESDELAAAARGLKPSVTQCIGFSVPVVFREGGTPDTPYVADLYDHVSFLGDLNGQVANLPDGAKVRLVIAPTPH